VRGKAGQPTSIAATRQATSIYVSNYFNLTEQDALGSANTAPGRQFYRLGAARMGPPPVLSGPASACFSGFPAVAYSQSAH
jgi:hypothetical protein